MTARNFILTGQKYNSTVSGTISINGTEVFNGEFSGIINTIGSDLAVGTYTLDDSVDRWVPVTIALTSGVLDVGFFMWDGVGKTNPVYTSEQIAILNNPASTSEERTAIRLSVDPTLTAEEIAVLNTRPDPATYEARLAILKAHNLTIKIPDPDTNSSGLVPDSPDTRRNLLINDSSLPVEWSPGEPVLMYDGDVLTFETFVFNTNYS